MRTTIRFPADLLRQVKARAAAEGRTLNSALEEAARVWLEPPPPAADRPYPPLPFSKHVGGLRPGINLDRTSEVLEWLDEDLPLDQRR